MVAKRILLLKLRDINFHVKSRLKDFRLRSLLIFAVILISIILTFNCNSATDEIVALQPRFDVVSNTTISVYVNSWVANNSTLSFTGDLRQENGEGVGNATINVTWEGVYKGNNTTAANGIFSFSFIARGPARSSYTLNVSFAGSKYFNASYNETKIIVKHPVILTLQILNPVVVVEENLTINGTIKDDDGNLLDESLQLKIDGAVVTKFNSSNGNFSVTHYIKREMTAGNHTVTIVHPESNYYLYKETSPQNIIVKRKTEILLDSKDVGRNTTANVTGFLIDNMGVKLANEIVIVRWWNGTEESAETDEVGRFSLKFNVGAPPTSTIAVNTTFRGTHYYQGSYNNTTYKVIRGVIIKLDKDKRAVRNYYVNITGKVVDDENKSLPNTNISIYWQGVLPNNTTTTDFTGNFIYSCFVPRTHSLGNVNIIAIFWGNETFAYAEESTNYVIASETRIEIELEPERARRNSIVKITCNIFADNGTLATEDELKLKVFWNNITINTTVTKAGKFSFSWLVPSNQSLGYARVIAQVERSSKYEGNFTVRDYEIYSETYIQVKSGRATRNATVEISGSIMDDQDAPLQGAALEIYWENITLPITAYSNSSGLFSGLYHIPYNHSLGEVNVTVKFRGIGFYNCTEATAIYTIYSNTTLILFPKDNKIYKNSTVEINGTILDDRAQIVANESVSIFWKDSIVGSVSSALNGFSLLYNVSVLETVGEVKVGAKFYGTSIYEPSENITYYKIYSNTTILVFLPDYAVRNEDFSIEAQLIEKDSLLLIPQSYLLLYIANHSLSVSYTNTQGFANFTFVIPNHLTLGSQSIKIEFNGSTYYEYTKFEGSIAIKERITIAISDLPSAIEANTELKCIIMLTPKLPNANIKLKFALSGEKVENITIVLRVGKIIDELFTDANGTVERILQTDTKGNLSFSLTVLDFVGNLTLEAVTEFAGTRYYEDYMPSSISCSVSIYEKRLYGLPTWVYLLPLLAIIPISFVCYILRRRHLAKMRKIIEVAKGELVAGSEYVKTILELYHKLCSHLKKFGFLRKSFETFREFEYAVRKALLIAEEQLDKFIDIIEEVRYSQHEITASHRDIAIANFKGVEQSIKELEEAMKRK